MENNEQPPKVPVFASESEEADWWASEPGRAFLRAHSAKSGISSGKGSELVKELVRSKTTQIALRLAPADVDRARTLAARKGIGYQTLLKILIREGLDREEKRK